MAERKARRSSEQIKSDRIIKKELLKLADKILERAVPESRRREFIDKGGRLQDEMNARVFNDVNLVMTQMMYGAYNYPKKDNTKRQYSGGKLVITEGMNALLLVINEMRPEATKIIIDTINDLILAPFKEKK
jgi:hypothetical protein